MSCMNLIHALTTRKWRTTVVLCILVDLLLIMSLLSWYLDHQLSARHKIKLLYMLQTESCLSDYLQEVIGNPSVCPCDVLVLSYRRKCDKLPPPNVQYIYTRIWTSWARGRNMLYEEAMKRKQEYLYFILMDDDIVLSDHEGESESSGDPWRRFEEFLARVEPAMAAIDTESKLWLRRAANGRKNLGCYSNIDESAEYFSVARFDAIFNTFHNKTIRNILPYSLKFNHISWIFAPMHISIKIELLYAGHSVLHNRIFATNQMRRLYLKRWPSARQWNTIVNEAASGLPVKYRNCSLMQGWRKDHTKHEQKSPTVCLRPPPPKMPIREFAYVDGILTSLYSLNICFKCQSINTYTL